MKSDLLAVFGAFFGSCGASLIWHFFYAVGSGVIPDETYVGLESTVQVWGAAAGAGSGFALGVVPGAYLLAALGVVQMVSVVAGAVVGVAGDWKSGLIGFFAPHVAVVVGCLLYGLLASKTPRLQNR